MQGATDPVIGLVQLAHGSGGRWTRELVTDLIVPAFRNPALAELGDSALLAMPETGRLAFTTDGFVVDPIEFPGGDLGSMAVCGTVNDLAVSGARPLALSMAFILEEGCPFDLLERLVASMAAMARRVGVPIVCGDTKVVPRGKGDLLYVVSSGIGVRAPELDLGDARIQPGDRLLMSGPIGDHGLTILATRHGMSGEDLRSDCAPLHGLCAGLIESGATVRVMHDPTRGGVAGCCHEMMSGRPLAIVLREQDLPVRSSVRAVADVLGVDPLHAACEGRLLCVVAARDAGLALEALRSHSQGRSAVQIGQVESRPEQGPPLLLETRLGVRRVIDPISGSELPRIC